MATRTPLLHDLAELYGLAERHGVTEHQVVAKHYGVAKHRGVELRLRPWPAANRFLSRPA